MAKKTQQYKIIRSYNIRPIIVEKLKKLKILTNVPLSTHLEKALIDYLKKHNINIEDN